MTSVRYVQYRNTNSKLNSDAGNAYKEILQINSHSKALYYTFRDEVPRWKQWLATTSENNLP